MAALRKPTSPAANPLSLPSYLLTPNSDQQQQLLTHLCIIHLLHHRNKNQHRRDAWYRHFNTFRRQLKSLCLELSIDLGPGFSPIHPPTIIDKSQKKSKSPHTRRANAQAASRRLHHWIDSSLIWNCYAAFSSLTLWPGFSALGLTLLALLARVCTITGITAAYQALAKEVEDKDAASQEEEMGKILERFAREDAGELVDAFRLARGVDGGLSHGDDAGTLISREIVPEKKRQVSPPFAEQPMKRKKKRDAIDNLFAGL